MKKIILLILTLIFVSCIDTEYNFQDPSKYKGCIVEAKGSPFPYMGNYLLLKLTPELRDSIGKDYIWIHVTLGEYTDKYIGDTIK